MSGRTGRAKALAVGLGIVASALGIVKVATIAWNVVMALNPISMIILGIGALVGALVYAWNTFDGFRGTIVGLWDAFKAVFSNIGEMAKNVLGGVGNLLAGIFTMDVGKIATGMAQIGSASVKYGANVLAGFRKGDTRGRAMGAKVDSNVAALADTMPGMAVPDGGGGSGSGAGGAGAGGVSGASGLSGVESGARAQRNITLSINQLIGEFNINTTNLQGAAIEARDLITKALLAATRDTQVAMQ